MTGRNPIWHQLPWDEDGDEGDLYYRGADGNLTRLQIPTDWAEQEAAGRPYVLGIASGHPAWRTITSPPVTLGGLGTSLGTSLGQD